MREAEGAARKSATLELAAAKELPDPFTEADIIFRYTRAEAIADGVLVDVSGPAAHVGFKAAVALTHAVWAECVSAENAPEEGECARLHQLLTAALARFLEVRLEEVFFDVAQGRKRGSLKLLHHIGDHGDLVATILLPGED